MDVVPCGEGWVCDPFQPEVIDGKLYGRGVLDNKGPMAVWPSCRENFKRDGIAIKEENSFYRGSQ